MSKVDKNSLHKKMESLEKYKRLFEHFTGDIQKQDPNFDEKKMQHIKGLKTQYDSVLDQYTQAQAKANQKNQATTYTDTINPYLNQNIQLEDGTKWYISAAGIAQPYMTDTIFNATAGKNGCPSTSSIKKVKKADFNFLAGSPIIQAQSCGYAEKNVYVGQMLPSTEKIKETYLGCFQDNAETPLMTFMGTTTAITTDINKVSNANFEQPVISSNSYQYINSDNTQVPNWNFNAVLLNNSNAWGFTMPYPYGAQVCCIQKQQSISQYIDFVVGTYTLELYSTGRQGFGSNTIQVNLNDIAIWSFTPVVGEWKKYTTTLDISTDGQYKIQFMGTATQDYDTALQNIKIQGGTNGVAPMFSFEACRKNAETLGYRYFSLQNMNESTGKGYCGVSNDGVGPQTLGVGVVISGGVSIWSSGTKTSETGYVASLTSLGSLTILDNAGKTIFSTPTQEKQYSYLGCFQDNSDRAMSLYNGGAQLYDFEQCQKAAVEQGTTYFGLQNSSTGKNAQCALSSDLTSVQKYGPATTCTMTGEGYNSGGAWSNAVYNVKAGSASYYLILQDDGNMCIYRGTNPSDNQGVVWCSGTNGKQQKVNPQYTAIKGKYGQNWMPSGGNLAAGEWIGSNDGSMYLIMEQGGSLVLYTSQSVSNCKKVGTYYGGGVGANAIYDMGTVGYTQNMGKIGRVNKDNVLTEYAKDMYEWVGNSTYALFSGFNSEGNDLEGHNTPITGQTADTCKQVCNETAGCAGFVFDNSKQICTLKNSSMYPATQNLSYAEMNDTFVRRPTPTNQKKSIETANIDSIMYQNYVKSTEKMASAYKEAFVSNVKTVDQQYAEQLKTQLDLLASQISEETQQLKAKNKSTQKQIQVNSAFIDINAPKIKNIQEVLYNSGTVNQMNGILKDNEIRTLQENYNYLFWSILAVGVVVVAVNNTRE
jgi:hypothetical protein